ncbi:MAG: T9SS type A sorting domain-containing protein [bacterium]
MTNNYYFKLSCCSIILLFLTSLASAKTFYSIVSGNWSDKSSWSEISWNGAEASTFPLGKDTIFIGENHNIILNRNIDLFDGGILIIDKGSLEFSSGTLTANSDKGSYVQVGEFGALLNAGQQTGWVIGELRLFVGDGTVKRDLFFDVGTLMLYTPCGISFYSGTDAVAGYISMELIYGVHSKVKKPVSIDMNRLIGPKYWRLMQPEGSTFVRGNRNFDIQLLANSENEVVYVDSYVCCEIGFVRSWTNVFDWQPLWSDTYKSFFPEISCEDSRTKIRPIPNFTYFGSYNYEKSLVTLGVYSVSDTIPFGSTEKIGNSVLLGDFIAGNENLSVASVEDFNKGNPLQYSYTAEDMITFVTENEQINSISIFNTFGDVINLDKNSIKFNQNYINLDISSLPSGVYFLKTDNTITKFIVIR